MSPVETAVTAELVVPAARSQVLAVTVALVGLADLAVRVLTALPERTQSAAAEQAAVTVETAVTAVLAVTAVPVARRVLRSA